MSFFRVSIFTVAVCLVICCSLITVSAKTIQKTEPSAIDEISVDQKKDKHLNETSKLQAPSDGAAVGKLGSVRKQTVETEDKQSVKFGDEQEQEKVKSKAAETNAVGPDRSVTVQKSQNSIVQQQLDKQLNEASKQHSPSDGAAVEKLGSMRLQSIESERKQDKELLKSGDGRNKFLIDSESKPSQPTKPTSSSVGFDAKKEVDQVARGESVGQKHTLQKPMYNRKHPNTETDTKRIQQSPELYKSATTESVSKFKYGKDPSVDHADDNSNVKSEKDKEPFNWDAPWQPVSGLDLQKDSFSNEIATMDQVKRLPHLPSTDESTIPKLSIEFILLIACSICVLILLVWKRFWYTICSICKRRQSFGYDDKPYVSYTPL